MKVGGYRQNRAMAERLSDHVPVITELSAEQLGQKFWGKLEDLIKVKK